MTEADQRLIGRLGELGFSTYEARAYVGLLRSDSPTGYALSNTTGIPQPKVYETLRRLEKRGAAIKVSDHPTRYQALPAERLLEKLEAVFRERLEAARTDFEAIGRSAHAEWHEAVIRAGDYAAIRSRAVNMIELAETKVYVAAWSETLNDLAPAITAADTRGVEVIVLHFGELPFSLENGRAFQHGSTDGALYRRHRARQLAIVADSASALWALAPNRNDWGAMYSEEYHFVTAIKAYLRHDIYVQRIYAELSDEMHELFGPGLEYLIDISSSDVLRSRNDQDVDSIAARRRAAS